MCQLHQIYSDLILNQFEILRLKYCFATNMCKLIGGSHIFINNDKKIFLLDARTCFETNVFPFLIFISFSLTTFLHLHLDVQFKRVGRLYYSFISKQKQKLIGKVMESIADVKLTLTQHGSLLGSQQQFQQRKIFRSAQEQAFHVNW